MNYCPYCGADLSDGTFSFCPICGNPLSEAGRQLEQVKRKTKKPKVGPHKKRKKRPRRELSERSAKSQGNAADPDYDGYYDDVLPADDGEIRQGLDRNTIKRIAGLLAGVLVAISACVAIMYLI